MFSCSTCLARCLRAIVSDRIIPYSHYTARSTHIASAVRHYSKRGEQTSISTRPAHKRTVRDAADGATKLADYEWDAKSTPDGWARSRQNLDAGRGLRKTERQRSVAAMREAHGSPKATDEVTLAEKRKQQRLYKELDYLPDPAKLADYVLSLVKNDDVTKAMDLVRLAGKKMECTVSWNHIINYLMGKSRVNAALKVYNEMKKRAQPPDSYTYVLILRGLAEHAHHDEIFSRALTIYHSMSAPNSKVEPTIMHTNATLKVAARCQDTEAMWGIVSKLPQTGRNSPDQLTYTTIINALKQEALGAKDLDKEEISALTEKLINDGRRMWMDIARRWRAGELVIDSNLTCAMGRLLLIGQRPRDWDDVLSLVEQTMNLPRLAPKLGQGQLKAPKSVAGKEEHVEGVVEDGSPSPDGSEFAVVDTQNRTVGAARSQSRLVYAQPDKNTLSLIIETCLKVGARKAATDYWTLLTTDYGITPDIDNLNMYLRLLRHNRASTAALETIRDDIKAKGLPMRNASFRIAMSTCVRDKDNHKSLSNAAELLDLMQHSIANPDVQTLHMYANLVVLTPDPQAKADALERLQPSINNLYSEMNYGKEKFPPETMAKAIDLFRTVIYSYDRVIPSGVLGSKERTILIGRRKQMQLVLYRKTRIESQAGREYPVPEHRLRRSHAGSREQMLKRHAANAREMEGDGGSGRREPGNWGLGRSSVTVRPSTGSRPSRRSAEWQSKTGDPDLRTLESDL